MNNFSYSFFTSMIGFSTDKIIHASISFFSIFNQFSLILSNSAISFSCIDISNVACTLPLAGNFGQFFAFTQSRMHLECFAVIFFGFTFLMIAPYALTKHPFHVKCYVARSFAFCKTCIIHYFIISIPNIIIYLLNIQAHYYNVAAPTVFHIFSPSSIENPASNA